MANRSRSGKRRGSNFMLKSLYRNYDKMLVWLNMLCINQHDRSEREYQVGLMGEIYSTRCLGTMRGLESIQWTVRFPSSLPWNFVTTLCEWSGRIQKSTTHGETMFSGQHSVLFSFGLTGEDCG
jgi:hypothetical protein